MDTINVSPEVLAGFLGISSAELSTALLVDNDGTKVPKSQSEIDAFIGNKLTEKVKKVRSKGKEEGSGWQKKETLQEVEAFIAETFGQSEGNWKDRLSKVKESKPTKTTAEITDEAIKSSALFKESLQAVKDELTKEREAHDNTKKEIKLKEISSIANSKGLAILRDPKNKFHLPKDKQEAWEKVFLDKLHNSGFQLSVDDKENPVLLDSQGNVAEDDNYTKISFDSFAKQVASSLFTVSASDPKGSPPNGTATPPGTTTTTGAVPVFKSANEIHKYIDANVANPKVTMEMIHEAKSQLDNFKN